MRFVRSWLDSSQGQIVPFTDETNIGQRAGDPMTTSQDTYTAMAPVSLCPDWSGMWELSWGERENVSLFLAWHCHAICSVTLLGEVVQLLVKWRPGDQKGPFLSFSQSPWLWIYQDLMQLSEWFHFGMSASPWSIHRSFLVIHHPQIMTLTCPWQWPSSCPSIHTFMFLPLKHFFVCPSRGNVNLCFLFNFKIESSKTFHKILP